MAPCAPCKIPIDGGIAAGRVHYLATRYPSDDVAEAASLAFGILSAGIPHFVLLAPERFTVAVKDAWDDQIQTLEAGFSGMSKQQILEILTSFNEWFHPAAMALAEL